LAYVQLSRHTKVLGTVIARLNFANRFGKQGTQFEMDAYPSIRKGMYAYINAGYSKNSLFPLTRFGFELYQKLPKGFEISGGFRYLNFDSISALKFDSSAVIIFTGSIGKYYGNYWFSVRPYLTPGKQGLSKSVSLSIRKYFSRPENYLSLAMGTGYSPDNRLKELYQTGNYYLQSQSISIDCQQLISKRFLMVCGIAFANEENYPGIFRNRYSMNIGLNYIF